LGGFEIKDETEEEKKKREEEEVTAEDQANQGWENVSTCCLKLLSDYPALYDILKLD